MAALRADDDLFHAKVSGLESTLVRYTGTRLSGSIVATFWLDCRHFLARLSPLLGCLNFACICLSKKKKSTFFFSAPERASADVVLTFN